jgi:UDP-N-acetylmuramate: L-alanyl-gamma-D-glutamyl-meso-diaminopimelate ligase
MRRNVFQERLAGAFGGADEVLIAAVFGADALPEDARLDPGRLVADLASRKTPARFLPDADAIVAHLAEHAASGDVIVVMSNGGFDGLHDKLLTVLETRKAT